jgi:hypothetical protein|nr:MAG TPA: hypothetical protein [Caudoviricetes sp.]
MKSLLFTFTTNMTPEKAAAAIKNTISQMGGSTKGPDSNFVGRFRIPKGWKPAFHTILKSKCRFYVGKNGVRAVLRASGTTGICVGEHQPIAEERVWDAFIRMFLSLYPECGANIEPGKICFDTVKVQDGEDIYTYSATTRSTPSIGGAILGGAVAGDVGALIGASAGSSKTVATVVAEKNPKVRVIARYTNGYNQDTELYKGSQRYHEILVNF